MILTKKNVFKLSLLLIFTFSFLSCVSVDAKNFSYKVTVTGSSFVPSRTTLWMALYINQASTTMSIVSSRDSTSGGNSSFF